MELIDDSGDDALIRVAYDELWLMMLGLDSFLEAVDRWDPRLGFTRTDAANLIDRLSDLLESSGHSKDHELS